jgi:hypothetical protein
MYSAPTPVIIPAGESVVYVQRTPPRDFRGFPVKDVTPGSRDLGVQWKGFYADSVYNLGHRECRYKDIVGMASASVTIVAWHDNCGKKPQVTLLAAGARHPVTVGVRQYWEEGDPVTVPDPELVVGPTVDPTQFAPGTVACAVDPDGEGPEPFQPAEVESVETDPPSPNIFRVSFTPPVPVTP